MAVDRRELAAWIGTPTGDDEHDAALLKLLDAAVARVEKYKGADTPEAITDQAVLRVAALLWYHRGADSDGRIRRVNVLADSGAKALLAPWRGPLIGGSL